MSLIKTLDEAIEHCQEVIDSVCGDCSENHK